jgi:hypothetical protein
VLAAAAHITRIPAESGAARASTAGAVALSRMSAAALTAPPCEHGNTNERTARGSPRVTLMVERRTQRCAAIAAGCGLGGRQYGINEGPAAGKNRPDAALFLLAGEAARTQGEDVAPFALAYAYHRGPSLDVRRNPVDARPSPADCPKLPAPTS